ncbi:MAG: hypothetical protein JWP87_2824, partial [Labilithrix sp.]|nr:hypothetical protein [Labilithrix sp.]
TQEATSIGLGGIGFGVARLVALGTENGKLKVYTADGTAGMSASLAVADLGDAWARIVLEYSIRDGFYDLYVDDKHVVTHAVGPTYLATDPSIFCSIGATSKATPSTVDVLFDNYAVVWK